MQGTDLHEKEENKGERLIVELTRKNPKVKKGAY